MKMFLQQDITEDSLFSIHPRFDPNILPIKSLISFHQTSKSQPDGIKWSWNPQRNRVKIHLSLRWKDDRRWVKRKWATANIETWGWGKDVNKSFFVLFNAMPSRSMLLLSERINQDIKKASAKSNRLWREFFSLAILNLLQSHWMQKE